MLINVIGWVLFGLGAGVVARRLHPGPEATGATGTVLLGIVGSVLGGGFAYMLGYGSSPIQVAGWLMAICGAVVLLSAASLSGYLRRTL